MSQSALKISRHSTRSLSSSSKPLAARAFSQSSSRHGGNPGGWHNAAPGSPASSLTSDAVKVQDGGSGGGWHNRVLASAQFGPGNGGEVKAETVLSADGGWNPGNGGEVARGNTEPTTASRVLNSPRPRSAVAEVSGSGSGGGWHNRRGMHTQATSAFAPGGSGNNGGGWHNRVLASGGWGPGNGGERKAEHVLSANGGWGPGNGGERVRSNVEPSVSSSIASRFVAPARPRSNGSGSGGGWHNRRNLNTQATASIDTEAAAHRSRGNNGGGWHNIVTGGGATMWWQVTPEGCGNWGPNTGGFFQVQGNGGGWHNRVSVAASWLSRATPLPSSTYVPTIAQLKYAVLQSSDENSAPSLVAAFFQDGSAVDSTGQVFSVAASDQVLLDSVALGAISLDATAGVPESSSWQLASVPTSSSPSSSTPNPTPIALLRVFLTPAAGDVQDVVVANFSGNSETLSMPTTTGLTVLPDAVFEAFTLIGSTPAVTSPTDSDSNPNLPVTITSIAQQGH